LNHRYTQLGQTNSDWTGTATAPGLKGSRILQSQFFNGASIGRGGGTITGSSSSDGSGTSEATLNTVTNADIDGMVAFEGLGSGSAASSGRTGDTAGSTAAGTSAETTGVITPMVAGVVGETTTFDSDSAATSVGFFGAADGEVTGGAGGGAGTFTVSSNATGDGVANAATTAIASTVAGGQGIGNLLDFGSAGGQGADIFLLLVLDRSIYTC
jgi:hypothetical protein